jgi:UDP-hydrolysing UDP-N-acetyl-D-glucosamine 2-epimerase
MHAAVVAAVPFNIPIAHIGGGEATEGLIDEVIRHSITKMSHLHFVSHPEYASRVIQMGEDPWRVTITGSLSLDNLHGLQPLSSRELESRIGLPLNPVPIVATYHPLTLAPDQTRKNILELLAAFDELGAPVVFTASNADTKGREIMEAIKDYVERHANARIVNNLGMQGYFSLLRHAAAMVGNSSSGILEAASFELPVVNIGDRQRGRLHAENVLDCGEQRHSIRDALRKAIDRDFRRSLKGLKNPYGDGTAAPHMIRVLTSVQLSPELLMKRFYRGG